MNGANPVAVQRLAGHATLETTLRKYGHLIPDYMRQEAERLRFGISDESAPASVGLAAASRVQDGRDELGRCERK